jgi:hypothetical protein
MKRFLAMAAIALSITTAAQARLSGLVDNRANNTTMFAGNCWRVTHMARNYDGQPMCIMTSQLSFTTSLTSSGTAYVHIKSVKGKSNPFIQLNKLNWHFPPDMQVPHSINLDNGRRELVGVSKTDPPNGLTILLTTMMEDGSVFLDDFASSETMTIDFQNGNEPRWSVKMAGSRDATKSFRSCVKMIADEITPEPQAPTCPVPQTPTSPVPDVPYASSQPVPTTRLRAERRRTHIGNPI